MKYHFTDRLQDFEFHDSIWKLISWEQDSSVFEISCLNVHNTALSEAVESDLEIDKAFLTFRGISDLAYEDSWEAAADKKSRVYDMSKPLITHIGQAAKERFLAAVENGFQILSLEALERNCELFGSCLDSVFTLRFSFLESEIAWDSFTGPAWYRSH